MVKKDEKKTNSYVIGGLEVNSDRKEVILDGDVVKVTPIEFKILQLLIKSPGRVFSAEEIYELSLIHILFATFARIELI